MKRLIVIDRQVPQWWDLEQGVDGDVEVVVLPPDGDGVAAIAQALRDRAPVQELHILAHGSPGCLHLGTGCLDLAALRGDRAGVSQWAVSEIWLYGCNVAAGDAGAEFVAALHRRTGAAIAASTQTVGAGLWAIEPQVGQPTGHLALTALTRAAYPHTLYEPPPSESSTSTTAGGAPPPPETGRIDVTNPLWGNGVIEDGTTFGPTILDLDSSDGRYSQVFNVVNKTGVSVGLSNFALTLSSSQPGGPSPDAVEILNISGSPLTSLTLNPYQTVPIELSLKAKGPDGKRLPWGSSYFANFVVQTSGEPQFYNFPVSWEVLDLSAPDLSDPGGSENNELIIIEDATQVVETQLAESGLPASTIAALQSYPNSVSITSTPLTGAQPVTFDPKENLLKVVTISPMNQILDKVSSVLGTEVESPEDQNLQDQFWSPLQTAGDTAATTSAVGTQIAIRETSQQQTVTFQTENSSPINSDTPPPATTLEATLQRDPSSNEVDLAIAANDGAATFASTGNSLEDGTIRPTGNPADSGNTNSQSIINLGLDQSQPATTSNQPDVNVIVDLAGASCIGLGSSGIPPTVEGVLELTPTGNVTVSCGDDSSKPFTELRTIDGVPTLFELKGAEDKSSGYQFRQSYDPQLVVDDLDNLVSTNDDIYAGFGDDVIKVSSTGDLGSFIINGNQGKDVLVSLDLPIPNLLVEMYGGQDEDILTGGPGVEVLFGDDDSDQITGGGGKDFFVLGRNRGTDLITDFNPSEDGFYLETDRTDNHVDPPQAYPALNYDDLLLTDRVGTVQVGDTTLANVNYVEISVVASGEVLAKVLNGQAGLSKGELSATLFSALPESFTFDGSQEPGLTLIS